MCVCARAVIVLISVSNLDTDSDKSIMLNDLSKQGVHSSCCALAFSGPINFSPQNPLLMSAASICVLVNG